MLTVSIATIVIALILVAIWIYLVGLDNLAIYALVALSAVGLFVAVAYGTKYGIPLLQSFGIVGAN